MSLDPNVLREAQEVMKMYSTPQQELIKQNLYGPREARFAGTIVEKSFTVVSHTHTEPTETEALQELRDSAWEQITELCRLLREAATLIEDNVAGTHTALLQQIDAEVAQAEENFVYDIEDDDGEINLVVVVFPPLDDPGMGGAIDDFVGKLNSRAVKTWVADESDRRKRLKAMTVREIYNVGRVAAAVVTNVDGTVLDGWYNGLPWVEEVTSKLAELRGRIK